MKIKEILILAIIVLATCFTDSVYSVVSIFDVQIIPEQPLQNEVIEIKTLGMFSHVGPSLDESIYTPFNKQLQLDLFFTDHAGPTIPDPWTHIEEIGTLVPGNYDLTVNAYWRLSTDTSYLLEDTYPSNFTVVPEPAGLLLIAIGAIRILCGRKSIITPIMA